MVKASTQTFSHEKGLDIKADGCVLLGTISWNVQIMNRYGKILVVLITVAITPLATAEIYKCDGPDGPIYSDKECGPNATDVEIAETSGLSGVSDETKTELAVKKSEREEVSTNKRGAVENVTENKTIISGQAGEWEGDPDRLLKGDPALGQKPLAKPVKKRRD